MGDTESGHKVAVVGIIVGALVSVVIAAFAFTFQPLYERQLPYRIPKNTNLLLLDATRNGDAHHFTEQLRILTEGCEVDFQSSWTSRYPMAKTRIYFMKRSFAKTAYRLEEVFVGPQDVIDYQNQNAFPIPERPSANKTGSMQGFSEERDLVIFIGDDWKIIADNL